MIVLCMITFLTLLVSCGCDVPKMESTNSDAATIATEDGSASEPSNRMVDRTSKTSEGSQSRGNQPPIESDDWIFRPRFHTVYGNAVGGTCFLVEVGEEYPPVILTSLSLIGPTGGLKFDIPTPELGNRIRQLEIVNSQGTESVAFLPCSPLITLKAGKIGWDSEIGDIAAFQLRGATAISSGHFASQPTRKGERLWLPVFDHDSSDSVQFVPAEVTYAPQLQAESQSPPGVHRSRRRVSSRFRGAPTIQYRIDDSTVNQIGLCGAPLVNKEGDVVAIHVRTRTDKNDGGLIGFGNPVERFRSALVDSLRAEPPSQEVFHQGYTLHLPPEYKQVPTEDSRDAMWTTDDQDLGKCEIRIRLISNQGKFDTSRGTRMTLLRKTLRSAAKGSSYSGSANGELLSLPGLAGIKGHFETAEIFAPKVRFEPMKTYVRRGLILLGINDNHLVLASFIAEPSQLMTLEEDDSTNLSTQKLRCT